MTSSALSTACSKPDNDRTIDVSDLSRDGKPVGGVFKRRVEPDDVGAQLSDLTEYVISKGGGSQQVVAKLINQHLKQQRLVVHHRLGRLISDNKCCLASHVSRFLSFFLPIADHFFIHVELLKTILYSGSAQRFPAFRPAVVAALSTCTTNKENRNP